MLQFLTDEHCYIEEIFLYFMLETLHCIDVFNFLWYLLSSSSAVVDNTNVVYSFERWTVMHELKIQIDYLFKIFFYIFFQYPFNLMKLRWQYQKTKLFWNGTLNHSVGSGKTLILPFSQKFHTFQQTKQKALLQYQKRN